MQLDELAGDRYRKRVAIIVPYRARPEHIQKFVPHILMYFARDKIDRAIPMTLHIIEQSGNAPFNRGKLLNAGYMLAREAADYVCFHDVDYLPIWADYSWSEKPARLIWHGLSLKENWDTFFGGVTLFDKSAFDRVNGYPNCYWGWGHEDVELGERCKVAGLDIERRDGTYSALPHKHAGFVAPGVWSEEAQRTSAIYSKRRDRVAELLSAEGLSDLEFKALSTQPLILDGKAIPGSFHYFVDIGSAPNTLPIAGSQRSVTSSGPKDAPEPPHLAHITLETTGIERRFYFRPSSTDESVIRQVFQQQQYSLHNLRRWPDIQGLVARNASQGRRPLVIDAGANIGASTVYFATKVPGSKVLAIEPVTNNVDILRRNTAGLDVEVIHAALSANAGISKVVDPGLGFWGFRTEAALDKGDGVVNVTIPDLLLTHREGCFPFAVKIDIEGAEREVFSANTEWIEHIPVIIVELHDWLLPKKATALPFLRAVSRYDRDFVQVGENAVSIANNM